MSGQSALASQGIWYPQANPLRIVFRVVKCRTFYRPASHELINPKPEYRGGASLFLTLFVMTTSADYVMENNVYAIVWVFCKTKRNQGLSRISRTQCRLKAPICLVASCFLSRTYADLHPAMCPGWPPAKSLPGCSAREFSRCRKVESRTQ